MAWLFLKVGATSFGGPAVHIALLENEVVHRRKWLTPAEFLDLLGLTNLIPGPNSTEMAIHIGLRRAGWPGLIIAGACFILPAFLIVLLCAWLYVRFQRLPELQGILYGVKPVVIAVVGQALWRLGRSAIRTPALVATSAAAFAANLVGMHELLVLLLCGLATLVVFYFLRRPNGATASGAQAMAPLLPFKLAAAATANVFTNSSLFLFFLKVGSVLYGSGYVLLAFLRADLVERWGWLTEDQLLDAVAVGQMTPGPVFTTATFIGYVLSGLPGACLATVGIFLPAFIFVAFSSYFARWLRRSAVFRAFLDGVSAGSLAIMAAVIAYLAVSAFVDAPSTTLGICSVLLLIMTRISPMWLLLAGVAVGLVVS